MSQGSYRSAGWGVIWLLTSWIGFAGSYEVAPPPGHHSNQASGTTAARHESSSLPVTGLSEVKIGYFGPDDPEDLLSGDLWLAASMAIEEVNREGGYRGLPFTLVPAWSNNPWGTGISRLTRIVFEQQVWAVIAPVDGPSAHLAEQVVAKARLPLINSGSSDRTANLANVPWIFSCLPGEHLQIPVLVQALFEETGERPFLLISATDHDSRVLTVEFQRFISNRGLSPELHLEYRPEEPRSLEPIDSLTNRIGAILILAGPEVSADIVKKIRTLFQVPIIGGPAMGRSLFIREAASAAEGVLFPLLSDWQGEDPFEEAFRTRNGRTPDFVAKQTYDSVRLLASAIRAGGLDHEGIRNALLALSPWEGTNGPIHWDDFGQNQRSVSLATIKQGRVVLKTSLQNPTSQTLSLRPQGSEQD